MTCLLMTPVAACSSGMETESDRGLDAVWAAERAYWEAIRHGDVEAYLELWHPQAVVWPPALDAPVGVDDLRRILEERPWSFVTYSWDLTRRASRTFGDVAVVNYTIVERGSRSDGQAFVSASRVTRTWLWHQGRWKIVGGTSTPEDLDSSHGHGRHGEAEEPGAGGARW